MKSIISYFTKEYAFLEKSFWYNFKKSSLLGVFFIIYLFLIISNETVPFPKVIVVYFCFGSIVFATFLTSYYYLPKYFFPNLYNQISRIKYILWFTFTVFFGIIISYFFHCYVYENKISFLGLIDYFNFIFVLIFPLFFLATLLDYISSLKNKIYDIEKLNYQISSKNVTQNNINSTYKFKSENKKENFELFPNKILFVCAADNYIEIVFENEKALLEKKLLRCKLKTIENDTTNNFLIKTHRSYLCNLNNVSKITKNQNSYFLHFETFNLKIPVSALHIDQVFAKFNQ